MVQKRSNPAFDGRGLIQLVRGKALHVATKRVSEDIWSLSLIELEAIARPTTTDRLIKANFWQLLEKSDLRRGLKLSLAYSGITTQTNFYNHFLKNQHKVAWMLKPTGFHEIHVRSLQHQVLDKLESLISLPLKDPSGEIPTSRISEIRKAVQVLFGIIDKF